jgi:serine/threonine-protein kinase
VLEGDFDAAGRDALEVERLEEKSTSLTAHAIPARLRVEILHETGRDAEAARVAQQYLARSTAWIADPRAEDLALSHDAELAMRMAMARGGLASGGELEDARRAWVSRWRSALPARQQPFAWLFGYAATAETPEQARAALDALPEFGALPRHVPDVLGAAWLGRVHLLAGNLEEAVTWLKKAVLACFAFDAPFDHTRAARDLGEALERRGDVAGACAAYGRVLSRWGEARPKSRSAEAARLRVRALGCAP